MEAPIRAAPVTPVSTLAPSQRRLISHLSISGAAPPLAFRGGSWPRSIPDDRCELPFGRLCHVCHRGEVGSSISV